ncbi:probable inactive receptor kinase At1g27190 [Henckelia pumila]|uniref:probable inactive receptor kinase At1g27190 n=1 Tax=Henckelia pumila TaxID=405737 RepID=UPI003C6DC311
MDRLMSFDVSHNRLTGPLPIFLHTPFEASSFDDNPGLCGNPLNPCKSIGDPFVEVFVKGLGIGWAISFTLVTAFCSCFGIPKMTNVISVCRRNKGKEDAIAGSEVRESTMITKLDKYVTRISFQELANLTSNFCNESVIGFGKNGIMYKAFTPNGCSLAIKKLYASRNTDDKFVTEILSLGTQRHPNLLPLVGFCVEKDERFLVYK